MTGDRLDGRDVTDDAFYEWLQSDPLTGPGAAAYPPPPEPRIPAPEPEAGA